MIFEWLLHITPEHKLNVSSILYQSLRWNPDIRSMTRVDQNAVMLEVFKKKYMAGNALQSAKLLLEEFERRSMKRIDREIAKKIYKTADVDRIISRLVHVMKTDLSDVRRLVPSHANNHYNKPHQVWFFLNGTARMAVEQDTKWVAIASQNAIAQALFHKAQKTVEQFVINSDLGFNEEQYKVDEERAKERNLSNSQLRQQIALQRSFIRNLPYSNTNNKRQNRFNTSGKNKNNSNKFKEMIDFHNDFLNKHLPNTRWSKNHCGYWNHPNLQCRFGDDCNRKHLCPNCEGNHILSECPDLKKSDKNK